MNASDPTWFSTSLGKWLLEEECRQCRKLIPAGYYPTALQIGLPHRDYLRDLDVVEMGARFMVIPTMEALTLLADSEVVSSQSGSHRAMIAHPGALPFGEKAHSLIVMPHVLDFCHHPHNVLREINQILVPEGCVVLTGFNQFSLWGLRRFVFPNGRGSVRSTPWSGHNYPVGRLQDWLSLLGIEIIGACMMAYSLPLQNLRWRNRFSCIEHMGNRWWPRLGAVYMVVGRKREFASGTPLKHRAWRRFIPVIARPAVTAPGRSAGRVGMDGDHRFRRVVDEPDGRWIEIA